MFRSSSTRAITWLIRASADGRGGDSHSREATQGGGNFARLRAPLCGSGTLLALPSATAMVCSAILLSPRDFFGVIGARNAYVCGGRPTGRRRFEHLEKGKSRRE